MYDLFYKNDQTFFLELTIVGFVRGRLNGVES